MEHPDSEVGRSPTPLLASSARDDDQPHAISPSVDRGLKLLEVLDDMGGRFLDNADFLAVPDPGSFFR